MKLFTALLIIFAIQSCSQDSKNKNNKITSTQIENEIHQKKESFFVLYNIKDLNFINNLNWDFDNLYLGKSNTKKFEKLDKKLKFRYLYNVLRFEDGRRIDKEWFEMDLQAYIVAKLPTINNFQPTIIKVYGTDYSALVLANIRDNKLISSYSIYDLETSGPEFEEDTLIITRPKTFCTFKQNKLYLKIMTGTCKPNDNLIQNFNVKENNFTTTIDFSGKIITEKKDSSKYEKKCELDYFQTY